MAPHDWRNHWRDYLAHYVMAGLAGLLVGSSQWPGVVLIAMMCVYQMGSYWHKEDTLKRDLFDISLAFSILFCIGLALHLRVWQHLPF